MSQRSPATLWRAALGNLSTWKRGTQRAVHKPLLSLMLLARAEAGDGSRVRFEEIYARLAALLYEFGPHRKSHHPEYPFWHLQADGFWEVQDAAAFPIKKAGHSPTKRTLLARNATGYVPDKLWEAVVNDPQLRHELASTVLAQFWPDTLHGDIRQAVGLPDVYLPASGKAATKKKRDPAFRDAVMRAYEHRCAVCGYDGRLGTSDLALEAAHVQWHAYDGPDVVGNAMAMCSFHHKALDAGAVGLTEDHKVLVSADVHGGDVVEQLLVRYAGQEIKHPQPGFEPPGQRYVSWHQGQVFRKPARRWAG